MKKTLAIAVAVLAMASYVYAAERPASKVEIEQAAVGKTFKVGMKYFPNGRYTFKGGWPGRYTISDGQICVRFDTGHVRCDRIVTDGRKMTMVTYDGSRVAFE
jgi:hypothetical protein